MVVLAVQVKYSFGSLISFVSNRSFCIDSNYISMISKLGNSLSCTLGAHVNTKKIENTQKTRGYFVCLSNITKKCIPIFSQYVSCAISAEPVIFKRAKLGSDYLLTSDRFKFRVNFGQAFQIAFELAFSDIIHYFVMLGISIIFQMYKILLRS